MKKWMISLIELIVFVVCLALIIVQQRTVGPVHLVWMLLGLVGLIGLLYVYNKSHQ